jgi:predicted ATPase/DNA-binding CsgD family transcriptional regulator
LCHKKSILLSYFFLTKNVLMRKADDLIEPLTRRELEILALLAKHYTNKEIASNLNLSVNSVKWYARQIYGKLGIDNRRQVAARASELGLLNTISIDGISLSGQATISITDGSARKLKHNLPLQLTSFIGRKDDIQQVKNLLNTSRLVILTGAGGVGKTRLALAVAKQSLDDFKDGVWQVELAPLGDPDIITAAIASIFEVRADQNRSIRTALIDYLREKQLLLILDNCEHLIEACAEVADSILMVCPHVKILATSRETLGIEGEAPYHVPSLPFPEPGKVPETGHLQGYEAIQLFLERAHLILPEFTITETNAISLAQICQRLDGIPLALELAAARLQVLSLEQIAARLDDRFRLLAGGSRRALPRHQTLHALIDWSYELLTKPERTLIRRLSVFIGGWTLKAAESVCSDENLKELPSSKETTPELSSNEILDLLGELVNKSLIMVERDGDLVRGYRMLETIRQYAQEKLVEAGEAEKWHDRHLDYFVGLGEEIELRLREPDVNHYLELLDGELSNLRLALSWALGGECRERVAKGLRLGSALCFYWYFRGIEKEGFHCLKKGLEVVSKNRNGWIQEYAKAAFVFGTLILFTGGFGRFDEARSLLEESIDLYRESQEDLRMALAQCSLGYCLMGKYYSAFRADIQREEFPMARHFGEKGLAVCRKLGTANDLAFALLMNNYISWAGMEFVDAQAYGVECLALCEETGDKLVLGNILSQLGSLEISQGNYQSAERYFQKGFILAQEMKDKFGMMGAYVWLANVAFSNQDFERVVSLSMSCLELNQEVGVIMFQIVAYKCLFEAMLRQEKWMSARDYLLQYLPLILNTPGYEYDQRLFIMGMAGVAAGLEQFGNVARLLGAVEAQLENFYKPLDPWEQDTFNWIYCRVNSHLDEPTLAAAWSAGRKLTLEQAITEAQQISL